MTISVYITVDRAKAILAGKSAMGRQEAKVDPSTLTERERRALVRLGERRTVTDGPHVWIEGVSLAESNRGGFDWIGKPFPQVPYPKVADASKESVALILEAQAASDDAAAAWREEAAAAAEAQEVEAVGKWTEAQRRWLQASDEELLKQHNFGTPDRPRKVRDAALTPLPEVLERLEALSALKTAQDRAAREQNIAREAARTEAAKQASRRRAIQVERIIAEHCTDEQRRRHAAKLLPEKEALDAYRDRVFRPLDAFPRWVKINRTEVQNAEVERGNFAHGREELAFGEEEAKEATAEEFATLEAIQSVAIEAIELPTEITMSVHVGRFEESEVHCVERKSVKVVVTDEDVTLSRRYACP